LTERTATMKAKRVMSAAATKSWDSMRMVPCTPALYPKLLPFLDQTFGKKDHPWFAKYLPHIFNTQPACVRKHRIAADEKGIAGCIGIYPLRFRVGKAVLSAGGVGSVSTRPDLRGSGLMSAMLRDTVASLAAQGYDISWLGGNRFRYGNYGWDFGGRSVMFTIARRDLVRYFPNAKPARPRLATPADIPTMARLYQSIATRTLRPTASWPLHLKRSGFAFEVARASSRSAYLAYESREGNAENIVEVAGRPDDVLALMLGHCQRHKLEWLHVMRPDVEDAVAQLLFRVAAEFSYAHRSQVRIVNVASTWRKLAPEIGVRAAALPARRARALLSRVTREEDRRLILRRALGFLDATPLFPDRLQAYEWVRPVKWWISPVDQV
jgi:predicted N-acetyltransferase YhbS